MSETTATRKRQRFPSDEHEVLALLIEYLRDAISQCDRKQIHEATADFRAAVEALPHDKSQRREAVVEIMIAIADLQPATIVRVLRAARESEPL